MKLWDLMLHSAFDTDYSHAKRNYDRDQVKVEKFFWHTVINIYQKHNKLNFDATYRSLITLLYDRPALEIALFSEFEDISHDSLNFDRKTIDRVNQFIQKQKKAKTDLKTKLKKFVRDIPILKQPVNERIKLTNNYQPYLPSISSIIWQLNSLANTQYVSCPLYISKNRNIKLQQLNVVRKYCEAYLPYFLVDIITTELNEWREMSIDKFSFKKKVRGPSQAVARELVTYPWLSFQTKQQTAYRVSVYYSDYDGVDFEPNSINKAVNRFRDE